MEKIYVIEKWINVVEDQYSYVDARAVKAALTREGAESWVRAHDENLGKELHELYANHPWVKYIIREVEMV